MSNIVIFRKTMLHDTHNFIDATFIVMGMRYII